MERFYVKAPSVNAVRRALGRAPGNVKVVGRLDGERIACTHTMDAHSLSRHWPIILSRLAKAGLEIARDPSHDLRIHRPPDEPLGG
ncbi:MAG: hypothetical protein U0800_23030 [Isosphaeraceae bacterium]